MKKYEIPPITKDIVKDIFCNKLKINYKKILQTKHRSCKWTLRNKPGIGGLLVIESFKTYSSAKLSFMLTGQQGDVMKESVEWPTIAWNLIPL